MTLHDELKARNAKPGDRVVCEDGVYLVYLSEGLWAKAGDLCLFNGDYSRFAANSVTGDSKKFLRLDRPCDDFWDKDLPPAGSTGIGFNYCIVLPITSKKKITIEVEEGAEILVNGKRVEV